MKRNDNTYILPILLKYIKAEYIEYVLCATMITDRDILTVVMIIIIVTFD